MKLDIFIKTVGFLFSNRNNLLNFDYPWYGGLPSKIYNTFSPEAVDAVQNINEDLIDTVNMYVFALVYYNEMHRIGEPLHFNINKCKNIETYYFGIILREMLDKRALGYEGSMMYALGILDLWKNEKKITSKAYNYLYKTYCYGNCKDADHNQIDASRQFELNNIDDMKLIKIN